MSVIYNNKSITIISHEDYINRVYKPLNLQINHQLFNISTPYKTDKNTKVLEQVINPEVKQLFNDFVSVRSNYFQGQIAENNSEALKTAENLYQLSEICLIKESFGCNPSEATIKTINGNEFVFPNNCTFFCKNVSEMHEHISNETKFDLIVLDPPWWNKYIRRKRKKCKTYDMMYNESLMEIPIEKYIGDKSLIAVWCTNSVQHLEFLINKIFPKWKVKFLTKWYWLKVTKRGEPVCRFSKPPGKQPFEQIILASRSDINVEQKMVVSIPSALHSHKPPLDDLLKKYLPVNPQCLEVFARYLLSNWTSYGNEALRFQCKSMFEDVS